MNFKTTLFYCSILILLVIFQNVMGQDVMKSNDPEGNPYQPLISAAAEHLGDASRILNMKYGLGEPFMYASMASGNTENYGYLLTDLDGDGTDELIFSYYEGADENFASRVLDLFTFRDGRAVHPASTQGKVIYDLCSNGMIRNYASPSFALTIYSFYRLKDGSLDLVHRLLITLDSDMTTQKYYLTHEPSLMWNDLVPSDARELSESEYRDMMGSCEAARMVLIPFTE